MLSRLTQRLPNPSWSRYLSTGTVKWFNRPKGFGFITCDETKSDVFVHHKNIKSEGYRFLNDGERVEFDIAGPDDRRHAVNVAAEGGAHFIRENTYRTDLEFHNSPSFSNSTKEF